MKKEKQDPASTSVPENKFQTLFKNSGVSIIIIDIDGIYLTVNSLAASRMGCSEDEIAGKSMFDFLPPETAARYLERNRRLIEAGASEEYEDTFELPTGTRTFLISDQVLKDKKGKGYALMSSSFDITAHRHAEETLHENEEKYRLLVRNLPGTSVFLFNHDLRFILAEGYLHPEFGFTTPELVGKTLWEVIPKERAEQLAPVYKNALAGKTIRNFISEYKGSIFLVNILPVKNSLGEIIAGMVVSQDITENKRAEEELEANYSLLRMAGETAHFGGWSLNIAQNKVIWSDEVAAIHEMPAGHSPTLAEGINFYAPEWREKITQLVTNCAEQGISFDDELELITANGKRIWVRATGEAIRNNQDKIVKIQGAFQNINERKRTEQALRESEEKWRKLVQTLPDYVALFDRDGKYLFLNHFAEGFSMKDIEGKIYTDLLSEESKPIYKQAFSQARQTRATQHVEHTALGDNWTMRHYESYFVPIFENDQFANMMVIARDITDRKKTEKLLAESEANARAIMESTDDVLILVDKDGILLDCNETHARRLGVSRSELLGKNIYQALPPELAESRRKAIDEAISTGQCVYGEDYRFGFWIEYAVHPICIENKTIEKVAVFARDITKRKITEQTLKENEARLRELNATKDKFFSIIAHDLKSPFNSILGLSNYMAEQVRERNYEKMEEYATIIRDSSQRAMDLLLNLLEWSCEHTGQMVFSPGFIQINSLINEVVDLLSDSAQQKSISIQKTIPSNSTAFVDRSMFLTIMRNLVSNAIKFTNPNGIIKISLEEEPGAFKISVSDNGIGIRKDRIEKLFRIDENHSTLGTQSEKGTGLGLILCKEFVEKHRGQIGVESEPGQGSTFWFTIPK